MDPWISTTRLDLVAPSAEHASRVFEIHSDPRTYRHAPSGAMRSRAQAEDLVDLWRAHWRTWGFGYAAVVEVEHDRVIGFAGVKVQSIDSRAWLNLYYRFSPESWGRGFATEAMLAVMAATRSLSMPYVARVSPRNPASAAVAERLGLRRTEGVDPNDRSDHVLYTCEPRQSLG